MTLFDKIMAAAAAGYSIRFRQDTNPHLPHGMLWIDVVKFKDGRKSHAHAVIELTPRNVADREQSLIRWVTQLQATVDQLLQSRPARAKKTKGRSQAVAPPE